MEFSNTIQGQAQSRPDLAPSNSASKLIKSSYTERPDEMTQDSSTDLPTYESYGSQYGNGLGGPSHPTRQPTGHSFLGSISSAWAATQSTVSHFRIPKIAAPWEHEVTEKHGLDAQSPSNTAREFDHRRQRRRLFINSSFRLFTTAGLCLALAAVLYAFSTVNTGMTQAQKKGFNALITGLSIILGLNLASSLKGYAQMMRWRFLAASYRSLQDFELVMQCESQQAVVRLLWAGRTRGQFYPNKTQVLAAVWLAINISLQIVTALLGLTYSIDISETYVSTKRGNITIADLSSLHLSTSDDFSVSGQGAVAQNLGVSGQDYGVDTDYSFEDYVGAQQLVYTTPEHKMYWYTFIDQDPEGKETVVSQRKITTTAECRTYPVLSGGYAGFDIPGNIYITIQLDNGNTSEISVEQQTTGGTTWMVDPDASANGDSRCGDRCSSIWALQVADNDTVPEPRYWKCDNKISHVTNWEQYGSQDQFDMPDLQAWLLAGALGFSGSNVGSGEADDPELMQYHMYPVDTYWAPDGNITPEGMAQKVMEFTAGAIAALDFNAPRLNVTDQDTPVPAQVVHIQWKWACVVLGVVPLTQAVVLLLVIGWANKAVIKDASYLATARLLRPVVDKLGDRGCLLTSDEIAEELGNYKIVYGPRMPSGTQKGQEAEVVKHIDIVAQDENLPRWHGRMPAGMYDGTSTWNQSDVRDGEEMELLIQEMKPNVVEKRRRTVVKRRMSF